ncbi:hypothetical protein OG339_47825 (plasmid) [Streptosporangium sp. NBC_01495]|uniref:hypothetical protein n=1 Tax=Streptosporangium sp. NBC_01495 TaxID=2903899 RepID=UPI002E310F51|nr:hypothetical protein [Streptosporangium sp. NBC_01495]
MGAGRRGRQSGRRSHRVGSPKFSDAELAALKIAAEREGLSVGAFMARAAVAVAHQQLQEIPLDYRAQMAEFVTARVVLNRIGNNLTQVAGTLNSEEQAAQLEAVLRLIHRAAQRVEEAADAFDVPGSYR